MSAAPRALYVHFPFCLSLCPYCDFVVYTGRDTRGPTSRVEAFLDALEREIELRAPERRVGLASVYLGGGTPSLMSAEQVGRLLEAIRRWFGLAADREITLEVNPGADDRGDLAGFRAAGVNRISIGAQSMDPAELRRLGRRHAPEDVVATLDEARRAGFDNVSVDLLYDVPGQTIASWRATLEAALAQAPDHVSAYALTLDDPDAEHLTGPTGDHLPLRDGARRWRASARAQQDDDRAADMYLLADELLARAGLAWYEISNWARPGRESRHNLAYWLGDAWEAVGPGAHAFDGRRTRRWNAARVDGYLAALMDGRLPPGGAEEADEAAATAERAMLRLRTAAGMAWPADGAAGETFRLGLAEGLLEVADDRALRLTLAGRLLSNEVFARLMAA
jgi:putative oxygen-independent coproporphyrinogen III oxidase